MQYTSLAATKENYFYNQLRKSNWWFNSVRRQCGLPSQAMDADELRQARTFNNNAGMQNGINKKILSWKLLLYSRQASGIPERIENQCWMESTWLHFHSKEQIHEWNWSHITGVKSSSEPGWNWSRSLHLNFYSQDIHKLEMTILHGKIP